jgi:hypothetical protein
MWIPRQLGEVAKGLARRSLKTMLALKPASEETNVERPFASEVGVYDLE